jgi:hypothetical protein
MPANAIGQLITFAVEKDEDRRFRGWRVEKVQFGDTVRKIASRLGHPEDVEAIKKENGIRSATTNLRLTLAQRKALKAAGKKLPKNWQEIRVPGADRPDLVFHVLPQDGKRPQIVGGYAKFSVVDRPERVGLSRFDGYDPLVMEVYVHFEAFDASPAEVERDIALLERMAGRGAFAGAGVGKPPVIRVSARDRYGNPSPLIADNYQQTATNEAAPLWRVSGISWGDAYGDRQGRQRQLATVTLTQHTRTSVATRSVAVRTRGGSR